MGRTFDSHPADGNLLLTIEIPGFNLQAHVAFKLDVSARTPTEEGALELIDSVADTLSEDHKLHLIETELPSSEEALRKLRQDAADALSDWRERLAAAEKGIHALEQADIKVNNAKGQMNSMRDAYFKELLILREQLYRKQEAEKKKINFDPEKIASFDPADYNFDDEVATVIRQKAELLAEKFEEAYAEQVSQCEARVSTLHSKLASLRMLLDRKDQLLNGLMKMHSYQNEQALEKFITLDERGSSDEPDEEPDLQKEDDSRTTSLLKKLKSGTRENLLKKKSTLSLNQTFGVAPFLASATRSLNRLRSRTGDLNEVDIDGAQSEPVRRPPKVSVKGVVGSVTSSLKMMGPRRKTDSSDAQAPSAESKKLPMLSQLLKVKRNDGGQQAEPRPLQHLQLDIPAFSRSRTSPSTDLSSIFPFPNLQEEPGCGSDDDGMRTQASTLAMMCNRSVQSDVSGAMLERALAIVEKENLLESDERWNSLLIGGVFDEKEEKKEDSAEKDKASITSKAFAEVSVQASTSMEDIGLQCNMEEEDFATGLMQLAQEQLSSAIASGDADTIQEALSIAADSGLCQEELDRAREAEEAAKRKKAMKDALQGGLGRGSVSDVLQRHGVPAQSSEAGIPLCPSLHDHSHDHSSAAFVQLETNHRSERSNYKGSMVAKRKSVVRK
eukprot:TRINITY_DN30704_c0_g1_i1.p1 TRINITY_DN30704_c0_g1~~TRINITY_DN30704_c0_g1_i1.p1  ORF type:complete len:682 (+),score=168.15 TRINITY_DN30704_c0_g1_i1:35-2047(+)